MMRIAVFGASGFVGATLVERLWRAADADVVPVIHSSGNAARLARFGRTLATADALEPTSLDRVLDGCSHVVNCSRGPAEVMNRGLRNLLDVSRRAGVRRFVHLSSVAAYGDPSVPMLEESARPQPAPKTYGWTKNAQDQLVERAAEKGLSCAVLCPPNISGSYSPFLIELVESIRRKQLPLVEGGGYPCELVDGENLVHAIRLALRTNETDGRRIFITDCSDTTWADVAQALAPLADETGPLPSIDTKAAWKLCPEPKAARASVVRTLKHLCSSGVRAALRKDPVLGAGEKLAKNAVHRIPSLERALRRRFEGPVLVTPAIRTPNFSERLIRQQLRNIRYSRTRARSVLGYEPIVTPEQSMAAFRAWYAELVGWRSPHWELMRHLYA